MARRADVGCSALGVVVAASTYAELLAVCDWSRCTLVGSVYLGGFHPALALVPIVSFMPHSTMDLGLFAPREEYRSDTLNRFEHWWATPVQVVLLLFGFANAGVPFEQIGPGT